MLTTLLAIALSASCAPGAPGPESAPADTTTAVSIEDALDALTRELIDRPGVSGVGIGACEGNPCLKVYVVRSDTQGIAEVFRGFPVVVEVSGEIVGGSGGG